MWVSILVGGAVLLNHTYDCNVKTGTAVQQWTSLFREDVAVPYISTNYLDMDTTLVCATALYSNTTGYQLEFNRACPCIYQIAAVGHILQHSVNATWVPLQRNDILRIPLNPEQGYISYMSMVSLAPLGATRACERSTDCNKDERCNKGQPGLCVADRPNLLWVVGMICILLPILGIGVCAAHKWVVEAVEDDADNPLIYAGKDTDVEQTPLTEPVEITGLTCTVDSGP